MHLLQSNIVQIRKEEGSLWHCMFILEYDQSKTKEPRQCLADKWAATTSILMSATISILQWYNEQMKITLHTTTKWFTVATFKICAWFLQGVGERSLACIRQTDSWQYADGSIRGSSYYLVHGHRILILKQSYIVPI